MNWTKYITDNRYAIVVLFVIFVLSASYILSKKDEEYRMSDQFITKQVRAIQEMKVYIKNLPFDAYSLEKLQECVNKELDYIEYSIVKNLGEKELDKIKKEIKDKND